MTIRFCASNHILNTHQLTADLVPESLTGYEKIAWQFCHDWLSRQEQFTLHTSGSTGTPKPIQLTRRQMAASAAMTGRALNLQSGDSALVNLNVQYIAGVMMLVRSLELDLHLTIVEPSSAPLVAFQADAIFDFQSYVPLQLQTILTQTPEKLWIIHSAKAILVGGAPISQALEEQLQIIQAPIYQTYGMTETVSHVALRRVNGAERQDFYQALDSVFFERDERNCLIIHAPALTDAPVVTNDVVELRSSTTFHWLGRADNIINSGGVKVQAEKVEQALERIFSEMGIQCRFFVTGLPDERLSESVTIVIEGELLNKESENSIFQKLQTSLSRYEIPKRILYIPQFAETPTGKVNRGATKHLV